MSILIKGMEMPTSCYACDMLELSGVVGCDHAYDTKNSDWGRALNCPLIPVPPHGRLIDADEMVASVKRQTEIMREIAKEVDKLKPIANSKELDDVDIVAIAETVEKGVLQEIANAPTILEAEVEDG